MKKYILFLFCISFFAFSNENVDSVFQKSNELYKLNDFENAIEGYLSIVNQNISNHILYYNIGNAYYKLNEMGYARLYYEKAKLYNSKDQDIHHNLALVENQLIDDIQSIPDFFITKILKDFLYLFSLNQWAMISLGLLYFTLLLFLLFLFSSSFTLKSRVLRFLFLFLPLFLISLSAVLYHGSTLSDSSEAVLIASNAYVKIAPSTDAEDYFIIHNGIKFKVVDKVDGWSRIVLTDGKDGWVENKYFVKITK